MRTLLKKIHKLTGIDLSSYKEKQMKRRLESLISSHKFSSYEEYFNELTVNKTLYEEFLNYITINVTEFF